MIELNENHINYIKKDLHRRGLIYEPLEDELIDHICTVVENKMEEGLRFTEAYESALFSFGNSKNLRQIQNQTIKFSNSNTRIMLRNYLKIAFRNLSKHKFYSLINISGLAVGIACCLMILLFVKDELSYDKHFPNSDRIYRVVSDHIFNENVFKAAVTPAPMANALANDFPEVQVSARLRDWAPVIFRRGNMTFKEDRITFADSTFFDVFDIEFIHGNSEKALTKPNTIVITSKLAEKYFGETDVLGKSLITSPSNNEFMITGIIPELPENTHFHFDVFISMATYPRANNQVWLSNNFHTYFVLREGASPEELSSKFPGMIKKYIGPQVQQFIGMSIEEAEEAGTRAKFLLQPITDIHLYSDYDVELEANSDIAYVYIFSSIAIFILIIACINFMNLSTARSAKRAKEVGVRKVLGSYRSHLIRQFLTESTMLSFFSLILALGISYVVMPYYNDISGKSLSLPLDNPYFFVVVFSGALILGLLSGIYPAFFLSSFKPVQVLKGVLKVRGHSGGIRSALVVFQFFISIILIIGTAVIYKQLNYIQKKNLGWDKEQVLVVHDPFLLGNQATSFKNEIKDLAIVENASLATYLPVESFRSDFTMFPEGNISEETGVNLQSWGVDYEYIPTLGMEIIIGRNFSEDFPSDNKSMILNERAVEAFGFEDPLGQKLGTYFWDPATGNINTDSIIYYKVIGVVKNFHYESLKENIGPLSFRLDNNSAFLNVRFTGKDVSEVIEAVENRWKDLAPNQPFVYSFMDDRFTEMYKAEQKIGEIFTVFASLAIFIACLGLFALASFTAEQRTKEIGVRKVMGASITSIVLLLSREFGKLVLIAFIISVPIAIYGVNEWMSQFAYKTETGVGIYLLAGLISFAIAWLTMSYQSIKAARANPVDSLRSE